MNFIVEVLSRWPEIEKASIFGSRAIGNYKNGSDVDLVVYGSQVTQQIIDHLSVQLNEELPLPYYFDIVHYDALKHKPLKDHIDQYAKRFYC